MFIQRIRILALFTVIFLLTSVLAGCTGDKQEKNFKVGVLHFGNIGDYGWTYEAHLAAQRAAEELPYVDLSEREEACGPDAPEIMKAHIKEGSKILFCHSWDFGKYIEEVAPNYPDVIFMWGGGDRKIAQNTGIYFGRMYEGRYLSGMVAGAMTKTNKIGYAAAIPIPEVIRGIDAFARGVDSVNPEAKIYVEWINEWYAPIHEKEVTESLIDKGCDIITNHSDSYAPAEAAEKRGVYFISYHSDLRAFAPDVFLTGVVWNWALVMTDIIEAVHDGSWSEYPDQDWWYGLADGGVKLAPYSDLVPDEVINTVDERKQMIISGNFQIFPEMNDNELREISYFEPNRIIF